MIERRPWLTALTHTVLIVGVLLVAFPVYITFVASTHTTGRIVQTPMPLLPGTHLVDNYVKALSGERSGPGTGPFMALGALCALRAAARALRWSSANRSSPRSRTWC